MVGQKDYDELPWDMGGNSSANFFSGETLKRVKIRFNLGKFSLALGKMVQLVEYIRLFSARTAQWLSIRNDL